MSGIIPRMSDLGHGEVRGARENDLHDRLAA
jgi:hypothetical protein